MSQWKSRGKKPKGEKSEGKHPSGKKPPRRENDVLRDAAGRVHLVLHRDPQTGNEFLALKAALFSEPWQNELAISVANMGHSKLREGVNLQNTLQVARESMVATSRLADGFLASAPAGSVGCKTGCDHCCHQSVGVTTPEVFAIADHLVHSLSEQELQAVKERVATARERTRGLTSQERFSPEHPCPFLQAARCSIYEVRPLSCRGMNALDAAECADKLRNPEARAEFLKTGAGGRVFLEPIRAFHAVSAGLQLALSESFALDMRPLDLTAAIDALLNGSETTIEDEWLAGKSPLAATRGGDSSKSEQVRELSGAIVTSWNK